MVPKDGRVVTEAANGGRGSMQAVNGESGYARLEAGASDAAITCIVLVDHRSTLVLLILDLHILMYLHVPI